MITGNVPLVFKIIVHSKQAWLYSPWSGALKFLISNDRLNYS